MKKEFRIATMIYLGILGVTLGAVLFAGAIAAPVIFHSKNHLGTKILSRYQEGLLMTQIFLRLSRLVLLSMVAVVLYEGYKYKRFERDRLTTAAALLLLMSGSAFNYYYLPDIVNMQLAGEQMTESVAFVNTHKGSEIDFKLFALSIALLMFSNMRKALR